MGILGPDDAWFAGTFMNGNFEAQLLERSDLILAVGLDAKDFFNSPWRYQAQVVAINDREDTQRFVPAREQLVGDTLGSVAALGCLTSKSDWTPSDVIQYRTCVEQPFHFDEGALTIPSALRLARQTLPAETLAAVDAGFGKPLTSYLWSASRANQYFTAHGLSTMGYALPAANALKLVAPDRPVVAFMGDGSLLMRASEITVAVEQEIAPIYVVWMDGSLAQIETKQLRQHLRPTGSRLPRVSCAAIASAFGANGCDVHTLAAFEAALRAGLASHEPTLIGAYVDQSRRAEWFELMRG
jgi:acetolactate synthase-1/2/3 large subunit